LKELLQLTNLPISSIFANFKKFSLWKYKNKSSNDLAYESQMIVNPESLNFVVLSINPWLYNFWSFRFFMFFKLRYSLLVVIYILFNTYEIDPNFSRVISLLSCTYFFCGIFTTNTNTLSLVKHPILKDCL